MTSFYTNFTLVGSNLYLRRVDNGITSDEKIPLTPSLFTHSNVDSIHKDIYGNSLAKFDFESVRDAKQFIKEHPTRVFGYNRFDYLKVAELFPGDIQFDIDQINIMYCDIETGTESGFPNVSTANEEVLLITVCVKNKNYTFTSREVKRKINTKILQFPTEAAMLKAFVAFMNEKKIHVITGWNVKYFDMAYLINRVRRICGDRVVSSMSPFGHVETTEVFNAGRAQIEPFIRGVTILDYLELYQKFELSPRESYKLDYIAEVELGANKLEYEGTFKDFYTNDFDRFTEYNVVDVDLVKQLDDKLKFIQLAITMAYYAKCNYDDVYRVTRIWDNIIALHLLETNVHVESSVTNTGDGYEGAFVKDTIPGKYDWIMSFDAESLYPSLIIQYNISPETILPAEEFIPIKPYDVNNRTPLYQKAIEKARSLNATLCANGAMFSKEKQGFIPVLTDKYFQKRKSAKQEMKQWEQKAQEAKAELKRRGLL